LRKQLNQIPTERWQLGELERAELKLEWIRKTVRESRQLEQSFVSRSSALVAAK
jgi:hypothetical protein